MGTGVEKLEEVGIAGELRGAGWKGIHGHFGAGLRIRADKGSWRGIQSNTKTAVRNKTIINAPSGKALAIDLVLKTIIFSSASGDIQPKPRHSQSSNSFASAPSTSKQQHLPPKFAFLFDKRVLVTYPKVDGYVSYPSRNAPALGLEPETRGRQLQVNWNLRPNGCAIRALREDGNL